MCINEMTISPPVYNPEIGAFEAHATLRSQAAAFTYRVSVIAAPHADFDTVARGLKGHALMQHRQAQERTRQLLRDTVRAATLRTRPSPFGGSNSPRIATFLAA